MELDQSYIYRKEVDWSLLHEGLTIPVRLQVAFRSLLDGYERGFGRCVTLLVEGEAFEAQLINQAFDREKYPRHADMVQIRYSAKSGLAQKLRQVFSASYAWLKQERQLVRERRTLVRMPEEGREYLVLYTTDHPEVFMAEALTRAELAEAGAELAGLTEEEFERHGNFARRDASTALVMQPRLAKVRRLDRSIGEDLKALYDFRCQICGENFGKPYEQRVVEVHHIDQFVRSMNNDYDNLMVICPNHHAVIHKAEPVFDRQTLRFSYPNGYREGLRLNRHFRV